MQKMRALFKTIQSWLALKKRRRYAFITIVVLAALASTIASINGYGIRSSKPPTGPLAWFANSSIGIHEVDPQYSLACYTHDRYFPIGMPVDQSGWPVGFEYDIFTARYDCLGVFYPVPFIIDFALFAVIYAALLIVIPRIAIKLRRNRYVTRKRIICTIVAGAVSILVAYGTAHVIRVTGPSAEAPPIVSAVVTSSYDIPVNFLFCPSGNTTVEKEICQGPELCSGVKLGPSDPRYAIQGWPFAYIYSSLDPCYGGTVYPLIFLMDTLIYLGALSAAATSINYVWTRRKKLQPGKYS